MRCYYNSPLITLSVLIPSMPPLDCKLYFIKYIDQQIVINIHLDDKILWGITSFLVDLWNYFFSFVRIGRIICLPCRLIFQEMLELIFYLIRFLRNFGLILLFLLGNLEGVSWRDVYSMRQYPQLWEHFLLFSRFSSTFKLIIYFSKEQTALFPQF